MVILTYNYSVSLVRWLICFTLAHCPFFLKSTAEATEAVPWRLGWQVMNSVLLHPTRIVCHDRQSIHRKIIQKPSTKKSSTKTLKNRQEPVTKTLKNRQEPSTKTMKSESKKQSRRTAVTSQTLFFKLIINHQLNPALIDHRSVGGTWT